METVALYYFALFVLFIVTIIVLACYISIRSLRRRARAKNNPDEDEEPVGSPLHPMILGRKYKSQSITEMIDSYMSIQLMLQDEVNRHLQETDFDTNYLRSTIETNKGNPNNWKKMRESLTSSNLAPFGERDQTTNKPPRKARPQVLHLPRSSSNVPSKTADRNAQNTVSNRDLYLNSVYQRSSSLPDDPNKGGQPSSNPGQYTEVTSPKFPEVRTPFDLSPIEQPRKKSSGSSISSRFQQITTSDNRDSRNLAESKPLSNGVKNEKTGRSLNRSSSFNEEVFFEPKLAPKEANPTEKKVKTVSIYPVNNGCIIYQPSYKDINL